MLRKSGMPTPGVVFTGTSLMHKGIHALLFLYGLVVAVGVARSLEELIGRASPDLQWHALPLFAAYMFTMVPFVHFTHLHLWGLADHPPLGWRQRLVAIDFLMLLAQGTLFYAMAASIGHLAAFAKTLFALALLDMAWIGLDRLEQGRGLEPVLWSFLALNVLLALVAVALTFAGESQAVLWWVAGFAFARSAVDYLRNWKSYFGEPTMNDE
ncbi:MAG: hypothetical protein QOG31_1625 [Thermoplasmata archaeon]|jgi:hypothetical protein|nr:hypothetical protein [Thermoplasmata archaeon]